MDTLECTLQDVLTPLTPQNESFYTSSDEAFVGKDEREDIHKMIKEIGGFISVVENVKMAVEKMKKNKEEQETRSRCEKEHLIQDNMYLNRELKTARDQLESQKFYYESLLELEKLNTTVLKIKG